MRYLISILALLAGTQFCLAATIHVPADQPTIQAGIDAAAADDTVLVATGTYYEHLEIDKAMSLIGVAGFEATTIDGQGTVDDSTSSVITIVDAGTVEISGLTITGGRGLMTVALDNARGGGIYVSGTRLTISNCKVSENELSLENAPLIGGAGIFADSTSHLELLNTDIALNSISGDYSYAGVQVFGAGVYASCDSLLVHTCSVQQNHIDYGYETAGGAGLYVVGEDCRILYSLVAGNRIDHNFDTGPYDGGGICIIGNGSSLVGDTIQDNGVYWTLCVPALGTLRGGGLFAAGDFLSISGCHFENNELYDPCVNEFMSENGETHTASRTDRSGSCSGYGGAACVIGSEVSIGYCSFLNNRVASVNDAVGSAITLTYGGALSLTGDGLVSDNLLAGNLCYAWGCGSEQGGYAAAEGGGANADGEFAFTNNVFLNNRCSSTACTVNGGSSSNAKGGGAFLGGDCELTNNTFMFDSVYAIGGCDNCPDSTVVAWSYGGGAFGASSFARNLIVGSDAGGMGEMGSSALVDGGGVYSISGIVCSDFWNNTPNNAGEGWDPGVGENITADPLLCPDSSAWAIYDSSPCAPKNNTCGVLIGAGEIGCESGFVCGDVNGDGDANITDVVYLIQYIFAGGPFPDPYEAGDVNLDGVVDLVDAVYLIQYIFAGGPAPCEPID